MNRITRLGRSLGIVVLLQLPSSLALAAPPRPFLVADAKPPDRNFNSMERSLELLERLGAEGTDDRMALDYAGRVETYLQNILEANPEFDAAPYRARKAVALARVQGKKSGEDSVLTFDSQTRLASWTST